jgi:dihydroflavonol-4-reductase
MATNSTSPISGRSAFVTGATGFLGLNLVEQLCRDGWQVTALHRKSSGIQDLSRFQVAQVTADILDLDALTQAIPERTDAVFHLAADTSVWARNNSRQMRTNVDGTRNLLTAARRKDAGRVVVTSSWSSWGFAGQRPPGEGPINDETPRLGDRSWVNYERTKFFADLAVEGAVYNGLDAILLSPCRIVGRYDRHNWSRLIRLAVRGKLPGIPPGTSEYCHAEAVARAHIAAAEHGKTGVNYLLGGERASFAEMIATIETVSGAQIRVRKIPRWLFRRAAAVKGWWGDWRDQEPLITPEGAAMALASPHITSDRAQRELGYAPQDLETMIRDCYDWMVKEDLV